MELDVRDVDVASSFVHLTVDRVAEVVGAGRGLDQVSH